MLRYVLNRIIDAVLTVVLVLTLVFFAMRVLPGSISIELVFSRPGLGSFLISGILARDYPVVQAGLVVFAFFVVAVNLSMDLLYAVIDPRIRVAGGR